MDAQKNRLIEAILLSTHNMFGWEIRKTNFWYTFLTKGVVDLSISWNIFF